MKNYNQALLVMEKHGYPDDARKVIIRTEEKILASEKANKIYEKMYRMYWLKKKNFGEFKDLSAALSKEIGEHVYTVNFVLLLNCTKPLRTAYKKAGYSEEIYWNTLLDLKAKMLECKENFDIYGTFVEGWFMGFYTLERFGLGRLQFEFSTFREEFYDDNGIFINERDFVLCLHIPSHLGPLTYEARMDSYKKAFDLFKDRFGGKYIVICCNSWLLYPDNLNILPENSNSSDFILDFEPLDITQTYDFGDCWRIFGQNKSCLRPAELQRDTAMQKAFAEWFDKGKKAGCSYSMIIFDGEKIVTRNTREEYKNKYGY